MLPILTQEQEHTKRYLVKFGGLNCTQNYQEGQLRQCENLSSRQWPCLSQRYGRSLVGTYPEPQALHARKELLVVSGTRVLYGEAEVGAVTQGPKQIATVGNLVVIFPDKVFYNVETGEFGPMEVTYEAEGGTLTFTDSTITTTGEDFPFRVGDAVTITGCTTRPENNKTVIIRQVAGKTLTFYANTFTATRPEDASQEEGEEDGTGQNGGAATQAAASRSGSPATQDAGEGETAGEDTEETQETEEGQVTLCRQIPDLEFICQGGYRLWGVMGNTIYGSKYADPLNFQVFDGLSSDSYYIDVGSEGAFTACAAYSSHLCFFKENTLHKLYGTKPSNFQLVTSQVYGVQAGCEKSVCTVNETMLYKGVGGIYAYAGGIPELISQELEAARFSQACAATDGERYYVSMAGKDQWGLYVYDVQRGLWLQEDGAHCVDMAFHQGHVYLLLADGELYRIETETREKDLPWSATFCPFTETVDERKVYSRFHLRLDLAEGAWLSAQIRRDPEEPWQTVYTLHTPRRRTVNIPLLPVRSDGIQLRLQGRGECRIRTLVREFALGSDV